MPTLPWRVGRKLGRAVYLDERCIGLLDDAELARAVVEGLALLDELADAAAPPGWRARLIAWRVRVRRLRLAALRRQRRSEAARAPRARRAPRLARE